MGCDAMIEKPIFGISPWEDGEYVVTVNGSVCGCTVSRAEAQRIESWLETAWVEMVKNADKSQLHS